MKIQLNLKNSKSNAYLSALISVFLWGTMFSVTRFIMPTPLSFFNACAIQTIIAFLFFFAILIIQQKFSKWWKFSIKNWKILIILGVICYSGAYIFQYSGLNFTTSINQSILSNTQTFWVIIFNFFIYKHRSNIIFIIGSIFGFFGIIILLSSPSNIFILTNATLLGDILSLLAFALWGAYTSISQPISIKEDPLFIITSIFFWGSIIFFPILIFFDGIGQILTLNLTQWAILIYLSIGCTAIVLYLWIIALKNPEVPSEKISLISMLLPIVGIITSIILLGEILTLNAIIGCIIVLLGLFIANWEEYRNLFTRYKKEY
jgi:drug/metabolite transporter (DMT)-like permease